MFEYCYNTNNLDLYCFVTSFWLVIASIVVVIAFSVILVQAMQRKWKKGKSCTKFIFRTLEAPARTSFCRYLTNSRILNALYFYILALFAMFGLCLSHIFRYFAKTYKLIAYIEYQSISNIARCTHFFIVFLILEIILLRSHYIKKNSNNMVSAAVEDSKRQTITRFVFKKAFTFTVMILILAELVTFWEPYYNLFATHTYYYLLKFKESLLVLYVLVPKLQLLYFERKLQRRTNLISTKIQIELWIMKHLTDITLTKERVADLVETILESPCEECFSEQTQCCLHSASSLIQTYLAVSFQNLLHQKRTSGRKSLVMIPTNPRNTVRLLKFILTVIGLDFIVMTVAYGILALAELGVFELTEEARTDLYNFRLCLTAFKLISLPFLMVIVFDSKTAFGEFHSILEDKEFKQTSAVYHRFNSEADALDQSHQQILLSL